MIYLDTLVTLNRLTIKRLKPKVAPVCKGLLLFKEPLLCKSQLFFILFPLVAGAMAISALAQASDSQPHPLKNAASTMRVLANHLPPYMYIEDGPDGKVYKGFEHELATSLAAELGLTLEYIECHWQECLHLLKTGQLDVVHNLVRSKSRETFLEYVSPSYLKDVYTTVFYKRFNDSRIIDEFQDLRAAEFVIGYVGSTVYFPEFDNTDKLLKMDVKTREIGLRLLASGKIDVLAGFDELFDGMELENPNIKKVMTKTQYKATAELESFTAVSKGSPLLQKKDSIARALQKLKDNGDIQKWKAIWLNGTQSE